MVFRARETTCHADIRLGGSSSTGLTIFWGLSESFTGPHEENGMGAFCSTQASQASSRGVNDTQLSLDAAILGM